MAQMKWDENTQMWFSEKIKKKVEEELYSNIFDIWDDASMEQEYRTSGKKHFTPKTIALATSSYFYAWAATRLGIEKELAKKLVHMRCYESAPVKIAELIARHSTNLEVRSACETYINDAKGTPL